MDVIHIHATVGNDKEAMLCERVKHFFILWMKVTVSPVSVVVTTI